MEKVRKPDKIKKERLIQSEYIPNEEDDYQQAIQESILLAEQMEEKKVKELIEKAAHRKLGTKNIMIILKRLSLLDDKVDDVNKMIEPVLHKYNIKKLIPKYFIY